MVYTCQFEYTPCSSGRPPEMALPGRQKAGKLTMLAKSLSISTNFQNYTFKIQHLQLTMMAKSYPSSNSLTLFGGGGGG